MTDMKASPVESGFLTRDASLCGQTSRGTLENLNDSEEYVNKVWEVPSRSFRNRLESISLDNLNDQQLSRHSHITQIYYPSTPNIPDSYMKKEPNHPETIEAEPVREAAIDQEPFLCNTGETRDKDEKKKSCCQTSVRIPWCIVGFCVLVIIVLAGLLGLLCQGAVKDLSSCGPPCNESWIWAGGRCYYFSDVYLTWNESQKFCTTHDSTLAVLIDQGIKKTIERYRENVNYWIGLSKNHEEQWMWTNGSQFNGTVENGDNHHLRCAYLNSHLGALDCSTGRGWICVKDST